MPRQSVKSFPTRACFTSNQLTLSGCKEDEGEEEYSHRLDIGYVLGK